MGEQAELFPAKPKPGPRPYGVYTRYKPGVCVEEIHGVKRTVHVKPETDDHFLFKKGRSITINRAFMNANPDIEGVVVKIEHRGVVVYATREQILGSPTHTFLDEQKYSLRCREWEVLGGDPEWCDKLFDDLDHGRLNQPKVTRASL